MIRFARRRIRRIVKRMSRFNRNKINFKRAYNKFRRFSHV